jgi:hypothetical protein
MTAANCDQGPNEVYVEQYSQLSHGRFCGTLIGSMDRGQKSFPGGILGQKAPRVS